MLIAALLFLVVVLLVLVAYFILLKRDIRSIRRKLGEIMNSTTNAKVTVQTFDSDIAGLANQINALLERQKQTLLAAQKMSRELKQAITNVSHDLKTPLTSALGYLQMAKSDKTSPEKNAEYLTIVEKRMESLSFLLEELFEFSKIYEGSLEFHPERVNASNLLRDVLSLYYEDFTGKNVTPILQFAHDPVYIIADVNMLKRVFQNLIQNALVHGSDYFAVAVEPGARLTFVNSVEDTEKLDANRLFERFYTADLSRNTKTTGLGLAICKELVERQGGQIHASLEENKLVIDIEIEEIM
jgi:signal transduction histidine kinase